MAVAILPKRSHSAASVPDTNDLIAGELAVNTADTKIYMRDDSNNIVVQTNNKYSSDDGDSATIVSKVEDPAEVLSR